MVRQFVGATHQFHDAEYVQGWAKRFEPTPDRRKLFNLILAELQTNVPTQARVVELGIGPGYLAAHLLAAMPDIRYCGIDFSRPMLGLAVKRLRAYAPRVTYLHADLVKTPWWADVERPTHAVVSTWALHDLGSQENVEAVYAGCAQALDDGGILLNGDFIKPDGSVYEYERGRFEVGTHLKMLRRVGFEKAECVTVLEEELDSPTAAQNYACFKAS